MKKARSASFSRRAVLGGMAAAAAATGMPRRVVAQGSRSLKLALPWVAEGSSLFTFVAKARGLWAKHGLNVEVLKGSGSVAAAQSVATGQFDFGLASPTAGYLQALKGLPLVCIGVCSYDAMQGIGVRDDSAIKTPQDLEGKKMGSVVTSGEYPFLPLFAERAKFNLEKVDRQQIDVQIRDRLLADKSVDAISAFGTSVVPGLKAKGIDTRWMLYSKYGMPNYGNTLMTRQEIIAKDPALCEAVVEGCMESIKFCLLNPTEAMDIFFKEVPEMAMTATGRDQIKIGLGLISATVLHDVAKEQGLGVADPAEMKTMAELTQKYVIKSEAALPAMETLYTNQFVGKVKLTPGEWQSAVAAVKDYSKYLA
ncbi:MAG TPA: ABC transporter substrate-binding protein [Alphaproteobacteria bacterium]